MNIQELELKDAYVIDLEKREDERGFFARQWCQNELNVRGLESSLKQINNSYCRYKGTLRGLHFQYPPRAETKLVRCIKGKIWDVIVDVRKTSDSYGCWTGLELSAENRTMLYVPRGFAHGFISLTDDAEIFYMVSEFYSPEFEGTLHWDDSFHGIEWPIKPTFISEKDRLAVPWNDKYAIDGVELNHEY